MANKTFRHGSLRAADIVFTNARPKGLLPRTKTFLNVAGQRLLAAFRSSGAIPITASWPRHSHVMLGLDSGAVIHADGKLVTLDPLEEALAYGKPCDGAARKSCGLRGLRGKSH